MLYKRTWMTWALSSRLRWSVRSYNVLKDAYRRWALLWRPAKRSFGMLRANRQLTRPCSHSGNLKEFDIWEVLCAL